MQEEHRGCECEKKGCGGCGCGCAGAEKPLSELGVGTRARIVKVLPEMRGGKKFADVGLVPGAELVLESEAPFGSLIRVRVLETSMAFHRADAEKIVVDELEEEE